MLNKIKQFIINSKWFQEEKSDWVRLASIDAFTKAREDLEETNIYDTDTKAKELAEQMLNDLLSNTDMNNIVSLDQKAGLVYIGGKKADVGQLGNLKSEAEYIAESNLWKLMTETPKELAQRAMFIDGQTLVDMQKGKSILYTISTQEKILQTFKNYQQK